MNSNLEITKQINNIIHNEIIPIQQIFKYYEHAAFNRTFHFDGKIFRKCAIKCQELIGIARKLGEFVKNNNMGEVKENDKIIINHTDIKP